MRLRCTGHTQIPDKKRNIVQMQEDLSGWGGLLICPPRMICTWKGSSGIRWLSSVPHLFLGNSFVLIYWFGIGVRIGKPVRPLIALLEWVCEELVG